MDVNTAIESTRNLRDKLLSDPFRPRYHFVSPEGVCRPFDPNGAIFWKGKYHLFYITQLPGNQHCWGHASSVDLLHWRHHPVALVPGDGDEGIFSGCALVSKEGTVTIVYLGVHKGMCIATSTDDDLIHWKKSPDNPVIPIPKEGEPEYSQYIVHDPHVWLEGEFYYAILNGGSGGRTVLDKKWDTAYLFKSGDLIHWEYLHPFYEPNPDWTEEKEDCACPDFFRLGDKYMLLCISHHCGARYYLGQYENEVFTPERHERMNWPGGTIFAPESLIDDKGRRIFWAWVCSGRERKSLLEAGWSGVMSLPRILELDSEGVVRIEPAEELKDLRINPVEVNHIDLPDGVDKVVDQVEGDCIELQLTISPGDANAVGIKVRCTPDGKEQTTILIDLQAETLSIDTSNSSTRDDVLNAWPRPHTIERPVESCWVQTAPVPMEKGDAIELRVFLDASILEVFANGRQCVTQRIYPQSRDSRGVALFARGGSAQIPSLKAWEMAPSNPW